MKSKKKLFLLFFICIFDSHAYEITHETMTVTPGCEGGVLYSKIESGTISSESNDLNLNADSEKKKDTEDSLSGVDQTVDKGHFSEQFPLKNTTSTPEGGERG